MINGGKVWRPTHRIAMDYGDSLVEIDEEN